MAVLRALAGAQTAHHLAGSRLQSPNRRATYMYFAQFPEAQDAYQTIVKFFRRNLGK